MPYISDDRRFDAAYNPRTPGELNYSLTMVLQRYLNLKGVSYTHLNDCLGALAGAKAEFYRRVVVPYEEQKRKDNGDVYFVAKGVPFPDPRDQDEIEKEQLRVSRLLGPVE